MSDRRPQRKQWSKGRRTQFVLWLIGCLMILAALLSSLGILYLTEVQHSPIFVHVGQDNYILIDNLTFTTDVYLYKGRDWGSDPISIGPNSEPCIPMMANNAHWSLGNLHLYHYNC
jgi:hypothetical protein